MNRATTARGHSRVWWVLCKGSLGVALSGCVRPAGTDAEDDDTEDRDDSAVDDTDTMRGASDSADTDMDTDAPRASVLTSSALRDGPKICVGQNFGCVSSVELDPPTQCWGSGTDPQYEQVYAPYHDTSYPAARTHLWEVLVDDQALEAISCDSGGLAGIRGDGRLASLTEPFVYENGDSPPVQLSSLFTLWLDGTFAQVNVAQEAGVSAIRTTIDAQFRCRAYADSTLSCHPHGPDATTPDPWVRVERVEPHWADVWVDPVCGLTAMGELQCVDGDGSPLAWWGDPTVFSEADRVPSDVQWVDLTMDLYDRICLLSSEGVVLCGNPPYAHPIDPLQPPQPAGTPQVFKDRTDWVDIHATMGTLCGVTEDVEVVCAGDNRFLRADPSTMRGREE